MNKIKFFFITIFFLLISPEVNARLVQFSSKEIDPSTLEITVNYFLDTQEALYNDALKFSVDNPSYKILSHKASKEPLQRFDPSFKKTKKVFENSVTFIIQIIKIKETAQKAYLHISNYSSYDGPVETLVPIEFKSVNTMPSNIPQQKSTVPMDKAITKPLEKKINISLSAYISNLIKNIDSPLMRLLLVFLLGVLLSLTPCIYPMVPITIGILQSQGSKSILYNFLLALCYTCGIATTFAIFGLLASCTGPLCGQLLMQPLFIIGLIIILSYLALSMLGLYDVYIPQLLKPTTTFKKGSLFSSFIFGAASGTIASPCVSPGLVLLLSIVATLNSKILGFLLLFVFGIGLSTPLLIVGAFSSSLNLLPRAGIWMLEIKKLFGFMIFGMCFYYLSYIIPMTILMWFIGTFVIIIGIYYLFSSYKLPSTSHWNVINFWIGIAFIASSLPIFYQAYRINTYAQEDNHEKNIWHTSYEQVLQEARNENKKIFIDFWATFCPICLAINKTVLTKPTILKALQDKYVLLKVDGTHTGNVPYSSLKDKFAIKGFPTFLVVDPTNESVLLEMTGEVYDMQETDFIAKINSI